MRGEDGEMKCVSTLVTGVPCAQTIQRHYRTMYCMRYRHHTWMSLYHQRSTTNAGGTSSRRPHGPHFPPSMNSKSGKSAESPKFENLRFAESYFWPQRKRVKRL